jgi:hypothetical protein
MAHWKVIENGLHAYRDWAAAERVLTMIAPDSLAQRVLYEGHRHDLLADLGKELMGR